MGTAGAKTVAQEVGEWHVTLGVDAKVEAQKTTSACHSPVYMLGMLRQRFFLWHLHITYNKSEPEVTVFETQMSV